MNSHLQSRAIAAYLGMAIGDALGATVEFMTPREIAAQFKVHDQIIGGGWLNIKPGQVTDDTTMALALGGSIIETGKVDAHAAARAFDACCYVRPSARHKFAACPEDDEAARRNAA